MNHLGTIELTTERLTLRRFAVEDVEHMFYNWESDPEVTKYLVWEPHKSIKETEELVACWISQYECNDLYLWAIEVNDLEQPIGSISVITSNEKIMEAEVGFCIGKAFWHQGYTTEALKEVIRFLFEEVGYRRISAKYDPKNIYSGKVLEACGLSYEGTCIQADWNNSGICDMAIYGRIRNDAVFEEAAEEEALVSNQVTKLVTEDGRTRNVISDETMEYVGILAKLDLSQQEAEAAKKDMADMLDYIDQLNELDTDGIEPMSHVFPVQNVFREDVVANGDGSTATLANAPLQKDGGFKVPKTIGE